MLSVFVLLGLLAGAGYAALRPPMLTSTALVALPASAHNTATQAVIADSDPVLAQALRSIHPAVPLPTLRDRTQTMNVTSNILSVTAQGKTAAEAKGAANAVATSYIAYAGNMRSPAGSVQARVLEPAASTTGRSSIDNLLLMGLIGALIGLLIGAIVALAVSRGAQAAPAPTACDDPQSCSPAHSLAGPHTCPGRARARSSAARQRADEGRAGL